MARVCLITGATDGLGLALARRYAGQGEGDRLLLLGRRPEAQVRGLLPADAQYLAADLATPAGIEAVRPALDAWGVTRLDRLVLNAGVGAYGRPEAETPALQRHVLDLNTWAPMALTHRLFDLVEAAGGTIALVSSLLAGAPCPSYGIYGASKAALSGFARSLRAEQHGRRVRVVCVHPGAIRTALARKAGIPQERVDASRFPSTETVAKQLDRAIEKGRRAPTLGLGNRLAHAACRRLPWLVDPLVRRGVGRHDT